MYFFSNASAFSVSEPHYDHKINDVVLTVSQSVFNGTNRTLYNFKGVYAAGIIIYFCSYLTFFISDIRLKEIISCMETITFFFTIPKFFSLVISSYKSGNSYSFLTTHTDSTVYHRITNVPKYYTNINNLEDFESFERIDKLSHVPRKLSEDCIYLKARSRYFYAYYAIDPDDLTRISFNSIYSHVSTNSKFI